MANFKTITVRVAPEQYLALREEATRRAAQQGGHADASRIIRELVGEWMEKRSEKPKERTKRAK